LDGARLTEIIHQAILEASHRNLELRRKWEDEANLEYREKLLWRNECARLVEALSALQGFIETVAFDADLPPAVAEAMEAVFPNEIAVQVFRTPGNAASAHGATNAQLEDGSLAGSNAIEPGLPLLSEGV